MLKRYTFRWRTTAITLGLVGLITMLFPFGMYRENTLWCGVLIVVLAGCVLVTASGKPQTEGPSLMFCVNSTVLVGAFLLGSISASLSTQISMGPLSTFFSLPILLLTRPDGLAIGTALAILYFIGQKVSYFALLAHALSFVACSSVAVLIFQAIIQSAVGTSY